MAHRIMHVKQISTTNHKFNHYNGTVGHLSQQSDLYQFYPENPRNINAGYTTSKVIKSGLVNDQFIVTTTNSVYTYELHDKLLATDAD